MPCLPLTYIGIQDECYEIVRDEPADDDDDDVSATEHDMSNVFPDAFDPDGDDNSENSPPPLPADNEVFLDSGDEDVPVLDEPIWYDDDEEEEEDEDSEQVTGEKFWLRKSSNDDKAEIFKARHGVL